MNIGYVFDENYVCCAAVSIYSLLNNNTTVNPLHFWIFDDGISVKSKNELTKLVNSMNADITFIDVSSLIDKLKHLELQPWRGRYSVYIKLLIGQLLPVELKRITIIDADTIINGSVLELDTMDISPYPCAMALEGIHGEYHKYIHLENSELYNTGVIVYDLQEWRSQNIETQFINHLKNVRSNYMLPEEDPISLVLKKNVYRLAPNFNFITQFYLYNTEKYYKRFGWDKLSAAFYSYNELLDAQNDIRIYHCIDTFTNRPWNKNNFHPYSMLYDHYYNELNYCKIEKKILLMGKIDTLKFLLRKYLPVKLSNYMYYIVARYYYTFKAKKFYNEKD